MDKKVEMNQTKNWKARYKTLILVPYSISRRYNYYLIFL